MTDCGNQGMEPGDKEWGSRQIVDALRLVIMAKNIPSSLPEEAADAEFHAFYHDLVQLRNFILEVATGVLSSELTVRGYMAGVVKTLQANLRHMTWQTKMIAAGDFGQRLDFMGEFSEAFNSMTRQLKDSIETVKKQEAELQAINAGLLREISIRKDAQDALEKSEALYRNLTENMSDVVWTGDIETKRLIYVSPSVLKLSGFTNEEMQGQHIDSLLTENSAKKIGEALRKQLEDIACGKFEIDQYYTLELELLRKEKRKVWIETIFRYVADKKTGKLIIHGVTRDVSDRRGLEIELQRRATLDPLTGIYNRRAFLECAEKELVRCRRTGRPLSFLMLDLDHFKHINDSFGHAIGDLALQKMTETCSALLRASDRMGRLGGEEFAIYLVEADIYQASIAAERLREQVAQIAIRTEDGRIATLKVSIGVTQLRPEPDTLADMVNRADQALYRAKWEGRNRVVWIE